jgi:hypothetical protein
MKVQVPHRLTGALVAVDYNSITAFRHAALSGDLVRNGQHPACQAGILIPVKVGQTRNMPFGNYQHMHGRLRIEIVKCRDFIVLVDQRTDLSACYLAEDAI